MTMSWHMKLDFEPRRLASVVSEENDRGALPMSLLLMIAIGRALSYFGFSA
jgi:hypothetical protein